MQTETTRLRPAPQRPLYVIERCRREPDMPDILLPDRVVGRSRDFDTACRRVRAFRAANPGTPFRVVLA
jgi:hypothetical protein